MAMQAITAIIDINVFDSNVTYCRYYLLVALTGRLAICISHLRS